MKLKTYLLCPFAIFCWPLQGNSQQTAFSMLINGSSEILAVCENMDGNYVATGVTFSGNQANATIMEISPNGAILQQNVFGSTASEFPRAIVQASAGYYLVTGSIYDNINDNDWFVAKLDSALQVVWFKRMGAVSGNDYANSCYEVSPNHFVVTGAVGLKPSVVLIDSSGAILQQGYLNNNQYVCPCYKGRYLGNGKVAFANLTNALTVLDTSGNLIKQTSFNYYGSITKDISSAPNGTYAICGASGGSPPGSQPYSIAFAIIDSTLSTTLLLKKFYQIGINLEVVSMEEDPGGYYVLAVNSWGASGYVSPVLIKIDSLGNLISALSFLPPGIQNVALRSMIRSSDGSYLIVGGGYTTGFGFGFIAKVDSANSCFNSPLVIFTNTLANLLSTPHTSVSGTITIINPQVNSIGTGTVVPNYLCNASSLEETATNNNNLFIYPSLAADWLHVSTQHTDEQAYQMEIFQNTGKLVMAKQIYPPTDVDISALDQGIYFCRFRNLTDGQYSNVRFLRLK